MPILHALDKTAVALAMNGHQPSSAGRQRGLQTRNLSPSMNKFPFSERQDSRDASIQVKRRLPGQANFLFGAGLQHQKSRESLSECGKFASIVVSSTDAMTLPRGGKRVGNRIVISSSFDSNSCKSRQRNRLGKLYQA